MDKFQMSKIEEPPIEETSLGIASLHLFLGTIEGTLHIVNFCHHVSWIETAFVIVAIFRLIRLIRGMYPKSY